MKTEFLAGLVMATLAGIGGVMLGLVPFVVGYILIGWEPGMTAVYIGEAVGGAIGLSLGLIAMFTED